MSEAQVISLGCRLNISESEQIRAMLAGEQDLVVVNSCAVTSEAVRQTRQAIRRARRANPDARLLVTGLHQCHGRIVIDRFCVQGADDAQLVDHLRCTRK